ncbi:transcription repressor NadR [Peribacillus sp. NPDC097675]|uniref:transcription repressor NadR n=1 Tax=Peribacillus sp. NPDC097675 TaxID=3390618 RepID=UPI003D035797
MQKKKLLGEERRTKLLHILQTSSQPITGSELSQITNVSRQVIVGDITLLKARNEPIIATSQGYIYLQTETRPNPERTVACQHDPSRAQEELFLLVDIGITVKDVKVEHPVYGDLTASIMVSNRKEVESFLSKVTETNATLLSELTSGIHLHTISASSEEILNEAEEALNKAGILVN